MSIVIISVILIIAVGLYFKMPAIQIWRGNREIQKANDYVLNSEDYFLMKNVVLLTFDGLQKFDYIIVSRFGIFVVMVQHYSGEIVGTEYDAIWTQLARGKEPLKFSNPSQIMNERSQTLSSLLKLSKTEVFPIALFTGISGFRTKMSRKITFGADYLRYIRSKNKVLFNSSQIEKFVSIIEAKRKRQGLINESDEIERSQQTVSPLLQDNVCPECGSELEIRMSDSGKNSGRQILVCRLFPTCRHSRTL